MENHTSLPVSASISFQEKINWLRLIRSKNIGQAVLFQLLDAYGSAEKIIEQTPFFLKRKIEISSKDDACRELEKIEKFGAEILLFNDCRYPKLLREISDPAPVLTVKGDLELLNRDIIAIVGARNASLNNSSFAKKLALELGQNSIVIASGLARGIDAAAHSASILSGTIAVIAGGIDHIYPRENKDLYEKIAQHGLLISENAFGANPIAGNFVQRNRIISGISLATIIVEAGLKSGSLTTARFALEQGREVFAVPGSPFDPRCQGSNRLIKDGANMLENIDDILMSLPQIFLYSKNEKSCIKNEEISQKQNEISSFADSEITKISDEILKLLSFSPISIDELIENLKIPSGLISVVLVSLELEEKIENYQGKISLKN